MVITTKLDLIQASPDQIPAESERSSNASLEAAKRNDSDYYSGHQSPNDNNATHHGEVLPGDGGINVTYNGVHYSV